MPQLGMPLLGCSVALGPLLPLGLLPNIHRNGHSEPAQRNTAATYWRPLRPTAFGISRASESTTLTSY